MDEPDKIAPLTGVHRKTLIATEDPLHKTPAEAIEILQVSVLVANPLHKTPAETIVTL
jgi:hypothetical protein